MSTFILWHSYITRADGHQLDVCAGDKWTSLLPSWAAEDRAPSKFTFGEFIVSALDHMDEGEYTCVRINGTEYTYEDLERMYYEAEGK